MLSTFIYSQETADGLSRSLATFQLTRGNYKDLLWYKDQIKRATPEDLRIFAQRFLNTHKLVTVFLSENALFDKEAYKKTLVKTFKESSLKSFTLDNGLKVILYPRHDVPAVGISLVFPGGLDLKIKIIMVSIRRCPFSGPGELKDTLLKKFLRPLRVLVQALRALQEEIPLDLKP